MGIYAVACSHAAQRRVGRMNAACNVKPSGTPRPALASTTGSWPEGELIQVIGPVRPRLVPPVPSTQLSAESGSSCTPITIDDADAPSAEHQSRLELFGPQLTAGEGGFYVPANTMRRQHRNDVRGAVYAARINGRRPVQIAANRKSRKHPSVAPSRIASSSRLSEWRRGCSGGFLSPRSGLRTSRIACA